MDNRKAQYYTAQQLSDLGEKQIPDLYSVTSHLVYSSPATLAYNSPGAEGFGVKRAGLAIPDSVMLIVSPPCCGRNTSQISEMPQYRNRFFYLGMDETDLVTGRHLKMIPDAVASIAASLETPPSLVMICATCVDALLGTDWDRVARAAEEKTGIRVRPCYMYALTREGRKPPMVHVRQSLYSLLEKQKRVRGEVNLLGFFAPLRDETELYRYLGLAGVSAVRELSRCETYDDFQEMARAQFNLVLNPECRAAADDLSGRLGMPYMELKRFYDPERIHRQYRAFFKVLGLQEEDAAQSGKGRELLEAEQRDYESTVLFVRQFHERHPELSIAVGETLNADPFELCLALASAGAHVREVYGSVTPEGMPYITRLAQISPQTRFYCNQDPSMMFYREDGNEISLTLGKDAVHYHPEAAGVCWNEDRQPFGYAGVRKLYEAMEEALAGSEQDPVETDAEDAGNREEMYAKSGLSAAGAQMREPENGSICPAACRPVNGFRRFLTPFAPDQSGAVSVLYALGGMTVIVDAGGCAGNVCGFDEPRWLLPRTEQDAGTGAVFSAGLRDMDAILGRDDLLVSKLEEAAAIVRPEFIALVGTPVPAVIGTDFQALKRMAGRKTSLEILPVPTNGMDLYDKGIESALLTLVKTYAGKMEDCAQGRPEEPFGGKNRTSAGVLGFTPMDFRIAEDAAALKGALTKQGFDEVLIFGLEGGVDAVRKAACVTRNLVVSPAGIAAARYLEKTFGIPYETGYPAEDGLPLADLKDCSRILVIHQQVRANAIRSRIRDMHAGSGAGSACPHITAASWFMMQDALMEKGDTALSEEEDFISLVREGGYDGIAADPYLRRLVPFYEGIWIDAVHFAVSGQAPGTAGR